MDRHTKIRIAVAKQPLRKRQAAIERLLKNPEDIDKAMLRPTRKQITFSRAVRRQTVKGMLRWTPEAYLTVRDAAARRGVSMAEFVRTAALAMAAAQAKRYA